MSKYIKIDTALLKTVTAGRLSAKALWRRIMEQPSIDIVQCKECKYVDSKKCPMYFMGLGYTDDDFCSYGERSSE